MGCMFLSKFTVILGSGRHEQALLCDITSELSTRLGSEAGALVQVFEMTQNLKIRKCTHNAPPTRHLSLSLHSIVEEEENSGWETNDEGTLNSGFNPSVKTSELPRKAVYQKKILELGKPRRGRETGAQRHQELGRLRHGDWMHG
jgi:hypothetical protein